MDSFPGEHASGDENVYRTMRFVYWSRGVCSSLPARVSVQVDDVLIHEVARRRITAVA
jgi:hypothetical protein